MDSFNYKIAEQGMAPSTCCGDGICDINENTHNCPADYGITGTTCSTSIDFVDEVRSKIKAVIFR